MMDQSSRMVTGEFTNRKRSSSQSELADDFRKLIREQNGPMSLEHGDHLSSQEEEISVSEGTDERESSLSDSESVVIDSPTRNPSFLVDDLVILPHDGQLYHFLERAFLSGMGSAAGRTSIVAIRRHSYSSISAKARLQSFRIHSEAVGRKCGSNMRIKYGWYGASKDEICRIITYGFGRCEQFENEGLFGLGLYMSPASFSSESATSAPIDEDGLRHVLLCRVVLGNVEEVSPGSKQFHPSSRKYDSGVDSISFCKKYIIWTTHMNTHVLPEYVISFQFLPSLQGAGHVLEPVRKPSSPWMPFPHLIALLSEILPSSEIIVIKRYYRDYQEKKITRQYLIRQVRQIAGDELLASAIKSSRAKEPLSVK